ncbi:unnamed protein product [Prorocentrum cordatum]|uniref:Uncharacterized protein n=1 Tax=Prorocentrum cordatum TaxID=2364126 RepID=A0ABN9USN2_9DINO|nr:unnamed protein product [Polarella glacialis]
MFFIAQSAVLFRLGPNHYSFFASLLWPPFAEILGLVYGVLFACGAADGITACLFILASSSNTAVAFLCRVLTMDTFYPIGLVHLTLEYSMTLMSKVFICRLVNMMIAHAEAEPVMDPSSGHEADNAWVREHVLFQGPPGGRTRGPPPAGGPRGRAHGPEPAQDAQRGWASGDGALPRRRLSDMFNCTGLESEDHSLSRQATPLSRGEHDRQYSDSVFSDIVGGGLHYD